MIFDCCPRCNGKWKSSGVLHCKECEMYYVVQNDYLYIFNIMIPYDILWWYPVPGYCVYAKRGIDKLTILPMLPFDISAERLKLMILLS